MKIKLLCLGKTEVPFIIEGFQQYEKRMKRYIAFETVIIPALKNIKHLSIEQQQAKEAEVFFSYFKSNETYILLDEHGKEFSSKEFASNIQQYMIKGTKTLTFVVGGPYGFSKELLKKGHRLISLSKMTFSHEMIRLIFIEQLYRAMTILKNEPYHHE